LNGQGIVGANVVALTERRNEKARERVLSDAELVGIWNACRDDDHGRIVRLLMVTAQRREEVGAVRDGELHFDRRLWILPAERSKNGRAHDVPLSDAALQILRTAPRRARRSFVFGEGEGAFSGWSRCKAALDARILASTSEHRRAALEPWVLHDLRRTALSGMARLGVKAHVIDAVANHVTGEAKRGVAGVYNRYDYGPEKRQALDLWASHVESIVNSQARTVTPLSRTG
jgi:integrase